MARRLARRKRAPSSESLPHEARGHSLRAKAASKKPTPRGEAEKYLRAQPHYTHEAIVAREVSRLAETGHINPAQILAKWAKLAPATQHTRAKVLRRILNKIGEEQAAKLVPHLRAPEPRGVIASNEEIERLIAAAAPPLRAVLILAADCGLRYAEARNLRPENVDTERRAITFIQKGRRERTIPLTDRAYEFLATAKPLTQSESFVAAFYGREVCSKLPEIWWRNLKRKIGVRADLRIHDLRRSLATAAYRKTKDVRLVQQLLGHRSLASTLHYLAPLDPHHLKPLLEELRAERQSQ